MRGQAGWAIFVISLTPAFAGRAIEAAVGNTYGWVIYLLLQLNFLGIYLLLQFVFAILPTDARAIRIVCATLLVVFAGVGALAIARTLAGDLPDQYGYPVAALSFIAAYGVDALAPTLPACLPALAACLRCRGDRAMQPRPPGAAALALH